MIGYNSSGQNESITTCVCVCVGVCETSGGRNYRFGRCNSHPWPGSLGDSIGFRGLRYVDGIICVIDENVNITHAAQI